MNSEQNNYNFGKIFDTKYYWYKNSKYQIIKHKNCIYVCPSSDSNVYQYKPKEKYPDILKDFIEMARSIQTIIKPLVSLDVDNYTIKLLSNDIRSEKGMNIMYDCAEEYLKFANNYGLLGILQNRISATNYLETDSNGMVTLCGNPVSFTTTTNKPLGPWEPIVFFEDGIPNNEIIRASDLLSLFLPNQNNFNDYKNFYKYYSEPIQSVIFNELFFETMTHIEFLKSFQLKEKFYESENIDTSEILQILSYSVKPKEIVYSYNNVGSLNWRYSSLIEALSYFYINNLVGEMGDYVNVCAAKTCGKVFISNRKYKYCPDNKNEDNKSKCALAANMYTNRKKKEAKTIKAIIEKYKNGHSIEKLSKEYNTAIDKIKEWTKGI